MKQLQNIIIHGYAEIIIVGFLLIKREHGLVRVGLVRTVCLFYLEGKLERILCVGRIVGWIVCLLVAYSLHSKVLGRFDSQSALVNQLVGFCLRVTGGCEIVEHVVDECINKVCVHRA